METQACAYKMAVFIGICKAVKIVIRQTDKQNVNAIKQIFKSQERVNSHTDVTARPFFQLRDNEI